MMIQDERFDDEDYEDWWWWWELVRFDDDQPKIFMIYIIKQRKPSKCVSNKLYLQRGWLAVLCLQKMETDDRGQDGWSDPFQMPYLIFTDLYTAENDVETPRRLITTRWAGLFPDPIWGKMMQWSVIEKNMQNMVVEITSVEIICAFTLDVHP